MGGLAYILGGALQGVGTGMVEKAKADELQRRDAALAAYRQEEIKTTADKRDEGDARSTARELKAKLIELDKRQGFAVEMAGKTAEAQNAKDIRDRQWSKEDKAEEEARQMRLKAFETNQDLRKLAAEAGIDYAKVKDVVTDATTGAVSVITNGGQSRVLPNIIARPQPRAPLVSGGYGGLYAGPAGASGADPAPPQRYKWNPETGGLE